MSAKTVFDEFADFIQEDAMSKRPYIHRTTDEVLARCLSIFGAVEVYGTKWSGKTRCAQRVCATETAVTGANSELYQTERGRFPCRDV